MNKEISYGVVGVLIVVLIVVTIVIKFNNNSGKTIPPNIEKTTIKQTVINTPQETFTLADLANHNRRNDCWVAISNQVYNVTDYIEIHPSGPESVISQCGKDATGIFNSKHSPEKVNQLTDYLIGSLK